MLINLRNALMAGKRTPTAKDYVQDGLVAMWDGRENAGWGVHDATATTWKELVSGVSSPAFDSAFRWGENYLNTSGGTIGNNQLKPSGLFSDRSPGTAWTIEIVYKDYISAGSNRILFAPSSAANATLFATYIRGNYEQVNAGFNGKSYYYFGNGRYSVVAGSHAWTMVCDGTTTKLYRDGSYVAPSSGGGIGTNTPTNNNAHFAWNNPSVHSEKYCRLSLRNVALTAEDVAANYAIDKARFGLP